MRSIIAFFIILIYSCSISAVERIDPGSLAKNTLKTALNALVDDIKVIHIAKFNWPDSALGCPQPGGIYTQAIVPGHLVLLQYEGKQYRVHTGENRALICKLSRLPTGLEETILTKLKSMATTHLASALNVKPIQVNILSHESVVWPDTGFSCSSYEGIVAKKNVRGYLLKLKYQDRVYEYRTSRSAVKPCPAINLD